MKKFIAVLLAGALLVGGAVTAFAAPSPSTDSQTANNAIIADASGDITADEIEITDDASYSSAEVLKAAEDLGIDTSNLTVYFNGDIHMKSGAPFDGTVTVTFNVPGMTADKAGYVLHWKDGSAKDVTATKGNGTISATYNGFSPTAILVEKSAAAASTDKSGKSPKTGEGPFTAMMLGIIAVAAAGMVISRKKFA